MTFKIENYASSAISAAFYGKDLKIESADFFDELRDDAADQIGTEADNACTYYAQCMEIIQRYESEYGDQAADMSDPGAEFKASDWQKAMVAYAYGIAHCAIGGAVNESIDELVEAYELLVAEVPDDVEVPVTLDSDCPHGWAAHDRETAEGVMIWHRLEGEVEARSIHCGGFYLTATWTPARA